MALREDETRSMDVTLEGVHRAPIWPWIAGGVAVVAGAVIGGYFLFKPQEQTAPVPRGSVDQVNLASWVIGRTR